MNIRKADDFIADAQLSYQWSAKRAGGDVAERYLAAIAATCALIERHPEPVACPRFLIHSL